jgi:hypothetical protein
LVKGSITAVLNFSTPKGKVLRVIVFGSLLLLAEQPASTTLIAATPATSALRRVMYMGMGVLS